MASAAALILPFLIGVAGASLPASALAAQPSSVTGSSTPIIVTRPDHLSATLAPDESNTQALTVSNTGSGPLNWNVLDQDLSIRDFRRDGALTLNPLEYLLASAVVDPGGRYAYFGTSTPPAQIIKVDLQTLQRVDAITLPGGSGEDVESFLFAGVIDPAGHFAYFGTGSYPAKIVKIDLDHFERVDALTLDLGEDVTRSAAIDPAGHFAYFGTDTEPVHIVKIDLTTFERVGAIDPDPTLSYVDSAAAIDPSGQFAYFGVQFGSIVKIDLANFARVGSVDTGVGTLLASALVDHNGQFAYFSTEDAPGRIVKLDLASFTVSDMLTLASGEDRPAAAALAADGAFAYYGTKQTSPGHVVKIDLATFSRVGAITLNQGENDLRSVVVDPVSGALFFGAATFPGQIVKVSDDLRNCALPSWATATPSSGTVDVGASQEVDVAFNASGQTVGPHEATLCLQSDDPQSPRVAVPLTMDVRLADTSPQTLAFDLTRGSSNSANLSIAHHGSGDLTWTITQADPTQGCATSATSSWLSASPANGTLPPNGVATVAVTADATNLAAGPYAALLCVVTSAGTDTQTSAIPVDLVVHEPAPAFGLLPPNLSVTLTSGQTGSGELSILNTGAAILDWSALHQYIAPRMDDALLLDAGATVPRAAVVDASGHYAYFGTSSSPGHILKIDLTTFELVDSITLGAGEDAPTSAVIDGAGHFAYFGTSTAPGRVVAIDLTTFQRTAAVTLNPGEDSLRTAVIDPLGTFAYFGTGTDPGNVVKIDLASLTRVDAIALEANQDESFLSAATIDPAGAFAYFGGSPLVGKLVKIDLATFQRVGATVVSDAQGLTAAVIDDTGTFAYIGTSPPFPGSAGQLVKVDLAQFQAVDAIDLDIANYEADVSAAVIDPHGRFIYLATSYGSATRLVEIDVQGFFRAGPIALGVAEGGLWSAVIDPQGRFAYFGGSLYPGASDRGRIFKIEQPHECTLPSWLSLGEDSGSVGVGATSSLGLGLLTDGLALGTYVADVCLGSNDPARPMLDASVELIVTAASDRIFADGFDPSTTP
jgi:hypothetical protein